MEPIIAGPVITRLSNFFGIFDASLNTPQPISSWELRNAAVFISFISVPDPSPYSSLPCLPVSLIYYNSNSTTYHLLTMGCLLCYHIYTVL